MSSNGDHSTLHQGSSNGDGKSHDPPLICPYCGQDVEATRAEKPFMIPCTTCGQAFVVPSIDGATEILDPEEAEAQRRREIELDSLKMRKISQLRRTAMRSQSLWMIAVMVCAAGAVQLVYNGVSSILKWGWFRGPVLYFISAVVALWCAWRCVARVRYWAAESHGAPIPEPDQPPDFTPLSDGSQQLKNLDEIQ